MNNGFRPLALALIPWALAIGALAWLGVWVSGHEFHQQLKQEDRAAVAVGAEQRPTSKIKIVILPKDCTHITSVSVDGDRLTMYAKNGCHQAFDYMEWKWQSLSPDGTAIHAGYENTAGCPIPSVGKTAECVARFAQDDRTDSIEVWTKADLR